MSLSGDEIYELDPRSSPRTPAEMAQRRRALGFFSSALAGGGAGGTDARCQALMKEFRLYKQKKVIAANATTQDARSTARLWGVGGKPPPLESEC